MLCPPIEITPFLIVQPSYQSAPHFGVSSIPVLSGVSGPFGIVDPSRTSGGELTSQALLTFLLEGEMII